MLIRGDVFHVHTMSQFLEDDLLEGAISAKWLVFEPDAFKRKTVKEWFAIIMGASLLVLMIPSFTALLLDQLGLTVSLV